MFVLRARCYPSAVQALSLFSFLLPLPPLFSFSLSRNSPPSPFSLGSRKPAVSSRNYGRKKSVSCACIPLFLFPFFFFPHSFPGKSLPLSRRTTEPRFESRSPRRFSFFSSSRFFPSFFREFSYPFFIEFGVEMSLQTAMRLARVWTKQFLLFFFFSFSLFLFFSRFKVGFFRLFQQRQDVRPVSSQEVGQQTPLPPPLSLPFPQTSFLFPSRRAATIPARGCSSEMWRIPFFSALLSTPPLFFPANFLSADLLSILSEQALFSPSPLFSP